MIRIAQTIAQRREATYPAAGNHIQPQRAIVGAFLLGLHMCAKNICFWKHPILWLKREMHLARMRYIAEQRFNDAAGAVACSIFSVKPGDVLAVMAPQTLCQEQRARLKDYVSSAVPEGVKVIVLDGGLTIAAITQHKPTRIDVTNIEGKATVEADTVRKISKIPPWRNPAA